MKLQIRTKNSVYSFSILAMMTALYFCRSAIFVVVKYFNISTFIVGGITLVMFFALLFLHSFSSKKNISIDGILLIVTMALLFAVTLWVHPEYKDRIYDVYFDGEYSFKAVFSYGAGIYCYYLIRLYENKGEELYKTFKFASYVIALGYIWSFIARESEYDMTFGYQMEMAAILFLAQYFYEDRKKYKLIISIACILLAIMYGSRACIIGYVAFIIVYSIWTKKINYKQIIFFAAGILAVIVYNSQSIMQVIYEFLSSHGIYSRTLYYIANGGILTVDKARQNKIWPVLIKALKTDSIFTIRGVYGDRFLLDERWAYSHNFVLEILLSAGIIIGSIILIWIFVRFFKTCKNNKGFDGLMTIVFGVYALCELFFSNTFWQEPYFWAFVAMLVNCRNKNNKRHISIIKRV